MATRHEKWIMVWFGICIFEYFRLFPVGTRQHDRRLFRLSVLLLGHPSEEIISGHLFFMCSAFPSFLFVYELETEHLYLLLLVSKSGDFTF